MTFYEAYRARKWLPSLDGLRCLAIVPVVWHHGASHWMPGVLGRGVLGVDLFFAISGFLITTLLLRERDSGRLSVPRFYMRRAFRIFPLYYVVLAGYVVRALLLPPESPLRTHFFASLPFYATYTTNWFVDFAVAHPVIFMFSWSLATEEQFYAVWPWIVRRSRGVAGPAIAALLFVAIDTLAERGYFGSGLCARVLSSVAAPICFGSLFAAVAHARVGYSLLQFVLGRRWSSLFVLALLVGLVLYDAPLVSIHLGMALFVTSCVLVPRHLLSFVTDARPVQWVGSISYGIYMLHVSAIRVAKTCLPETAHTPLPVFLIALPLACAFAWVSFRFLETPFLRFVRNRSPSRPMYAHG